MILRLSLSFFLYSQKEQPEALHGLTSPHSGRNNPPAAGCYLKNTKKPDPPKSSEILRDPLQSSCISHNPPAASKNLRHAADQLPQLQVTTSYDPQERDGERLETGGLEEKRRRETRRMIRDKCYGAAVGHAATQWIVMWPAAVMINCCQSGDLFMCMCV